MNCDYCAETLVDRDAVTLNEVYYDEDSVGYGETWSYHVGVCLIQGMGHILLGLLQQADEDTLRELCSDHEDYEALRRFPPSGWRSGSA